MVTHLRKAPAILALICLFYACKTDDSSWETELAAPIINDQLSITDLLPDSVHSIASDSSIRLVFENRLFDYNIIAENIAIPDTTLNTVVSLDSLSLDDRAITERITLGEILDQVDGGGLLITLINLGFPVEIPAIDSVSSGVLPFDATDFFESAVIESGFLDIVIKNGLPVDATDVSFRISDPVGMFDLINQDFPLIASGDSVMASSDLSGLTVGGMLETEIMNISTPGSGVAIPVDTTDAIEVTARVRDVKLIEATAVFPAQNIVENFRDVVYDMGGPEITSLTVRSGDVKVFVVSTIDDTISVFYSIPGAVSPDGSSVLITSKVPPAPPGGSATIEESFDLAGYTVDLRGSSGLGVNTFYSEFIARIDSTGTVVNISINDSVQVIYGLEGLVPESFEGYLGELSTTITEAIPLDLVSGLMGGSLQLEDLNMDLEIKNGVGAVGELVLNQFSSINSSTGSTVDLVAPSVVGQVIDIGRALDNPFLPAYQNILLNGSNSNIKGMIENLPDSAYFDAAFEVNPDGNLFNYQDFISYDSEFSLSLNMAMPLSLIATDLTLTDTLDFSVGANNGGDNQIKSGTLALTLDNGFPLDAVLEVVLLDAAGSTLFTLTDTPIALGAAPLDAACRVAESARSTHEIEITAQEMPLLNQATKAVIRADFSTVGTTSCDSYLKIYSDYALGVLLTGSFIVELTTNF